MFLDLRSSACGPTWTKGVVRLPLKGLFNLLARSFSQFESPNCSGEEKKHLNSELKKKEVEMF